MKNLIFGILFCAATFVALNNPIEVANPVAEEQKEIHHLQPYADILKVTPNDIYRKIHKESSWNPEAVSHDQGASGLWQARKMVRQEMGLSKPLKDYTIEEQLVFHLHFCVKNGWLQMVDQIPAEDRSFQLWLLGFLPAYAGSSDWRTIPHYAYKSNKGLDLNGDKKVTISELRKWYQK